MGQNLAIIILDKGLDYIKTLQLNSKKTVQLKMDSESE
uniref:Macaca fascicularis brain cDNA clone: QmoA-12018, similar to human RAB4B, member RAS oncogene family (RAB4B), mRNA, RefSeq: NM_016154.2 n=1 Tax=Macaca fascicularis TaxID=9541 RepID=I7GEB3_MACFA|nr:unnamed protein product [Macaca fascicularis]